MRRSHADRSRLGFEVLEARDNPAGNVNAFFSGATLNLIGDAADNQIAVAQNSAGELVVTGLNGTTINRQSSINLGRVQLDGLWVNLGDGNDSVDVTGVAVTRGVAIEGGNGNDAITLSNVGAQTVSISGGAGDDGVTFNAVAASQGVKILGGPGADTFTNNGTTTPRLFTDGVEQPAG
jgi:hypothetical protein